MNVKGKQPKTGLLIRRAAPRPEAAPEPVEVTHDETAREGKKFDGRGSHSLAFAGVYLFTLLLYMRPNDLFPGIFGTFSIAKIVALVTLAVYVLSKFSKNERLTALPLELKMLGLMLLLSIIFMPLAASPKDSWNMLSDTFLKVVTVFVLMINLIDTRKRLRLIWKLVVVCGAVLAIDAIRKYAEGKFSTAPEGGGTRIGGLVSGMFGNPNDLATALNLLLPLALILAFTSKGFARLFYFACAGVLTLGVISTFSRGGFLGLIAMGGLLLWKVGRHKRVLTFASAFLMIVVFISIVPSGYGDRLSTIFNIKQDETGSAQERSELLNRAASLAMRHPVIGLGMGNFYIYSIHDKAAHNSYLEVAAELGLAGLVAYLVIIFAPFGSLKRIERETASREDSRELYYMSIGMQAALVAYIVCSFFASIEYLWYLYYLVAYAVAIRGLREAAQLQATGPVKLAANGSVWSARLQRPRFKSKDRATDANLFGRPRAHSAGVRGQD